MLNSPIDRWRRALRAYVPNTMWSHRPLMIQEFRTKSRLAITFRFSGAKCRCGCRLLALFGPGAMSDLSPQCAPKRTSARAHYDLFKEVKLRERNSFLCNQK